MHAESAQIGLSVNSYLAASNSTRTSMSAAVSSIDDAVVLPRHRRVNNFLAFGIHGPLAFTVSVYRWPRKVKASLMVSAETLLRARRAVDGLWPHASGNASEVLSRPKVGASHLFGSLSNLG